MSSLTLGSSGLSLMERGINHANAAGSQILESGSDIMGVAKGSIALSEAKAEIAVGSWLAKQESEIVETTYQILFGIGKNFSMQA